MEFLKILLLSIQQGITELLPISSSAHLLLTSKILDIEMDTYFLSVLHLGTTLALILHFRNTLSNELFKKEHRSFWLKILLSTIPAGIVGFFLESFIENKLRGITTIVISLVIWGVAMIMIERKDRKSIDMHKITWKQSLAMGISQIIALVPGTSRSGITTITGILFGVDKYTSLQYSFLLGLPLLLLSSIYGITKYGFLNVLSMTDFLAILISGIFTFLSLLLLKKFSKKNWLTLFGIYRILLALLIVVVQIIR